MKAYLVGGAVRDKLLGLETRDRDWVVTGSSPEEMLEKGYKPVGRDFPVFLHPETGEEYALARTERKKGHGYHGFTFHTGPDIRIEEDLKRRDFTINAMAMDLENNELIDPWGGEKDIHNKIIRHVSEAFNEDPLRVLRLARFSARFANIGFSIDKNTLALARQLANSGELQHLAAERIWQETRLALAENSPSTFLAVLKQTGALDALFPEVAALYGVPQPEKHHPEIDCGKHLELTLDRASSLSRDNAVHFAVLCHDLGKGITPSEILPRHIGHEQAGLPLVKAICERLKVPKNYKRLAMQVCEWHLHAHRANELKPTTLLKFLSAVDAFRQPDNFSRFLLACQADFQGRLHSEHKPYPQADYLRDCLQACQAIPVNDWLDQNKSGPEIAQSLEQARITALKTVRPHNTD